MIAESARGTAGLARHMTPAAAGLHRRRDVVSVGISDDEIRRRCAGGTWRRVRRGAYAESAVVAELDAVARHRLKVAALLPEMAAGAVVSHQSAAVVLGAPMVPALLDRVHVTRDRRYGGRIKAELQVHCAPVELVAEVHGLVVTSPARTVVDLARTLAFEPAVVVGDALSRDFGISAADLAHELEAARGRRGVHAARRVIGFLDAGSRGVSHSRARVLLRHLGFPPAAAGGVVCGHDGRVLGSADIHLGRTGVLLTLADPADRAAPAADRTVGAPCDATLRRYGFHLVRTTWRELSAGTVAARLHTAVARTREDPARGFVRPTPLPPPKSLFLRAL
ncbi:hypothetical protein [Nocardia spumae]|uniref:hypothetical protein n=1 Tax=Nocardia spumae TaxID=2887190 RepID=UPI001D1414F9|nr:hypothetical protein [Nocardia spumae]